MWLIHVFMRDMAHSHVTWLSHIWHDSLRRDMTHACETWSIHAWHDSFVCHTLIHTVYASLLCQQTISARAFFIFFAIHLVVLQKHSTIRLLASTFLLCCMTFFCRYEGLFCRLQGPFAEITTVLFEFTGHPSFFFLVWSYCWAQDMGRLDMGLVARDMHCIAPCMRPICHLKRRLPHAKSSTVQRCDTNWFVWDRHGTSYAPDVTSKEAFTASKEPYSAEVWDVLICVTRLLGITWVEECCSVLQYVAVCVAVCCGVWSFMQDVSFVSRVLQCVAACSSVLQCVAQCVLVFEKSPRYHHDSHASFISVTQLVHTCTMTHSYVTHDSHDSLTPVPRFVHMCAMTLSLVCHNSMTCVPWLERQGCIHVCCASFIYDITHSHVTWLMHMTGEIGLFKHTHDSSGWCTWLER